MRPERCFEFDMPALKHCSLSRVYTFGFCMRFLHCVLIFITYLDLSNPRSNRKLKCHAENTCRNRICKQIFTYERDNSIELNYSILQFRNQVLTSLILFISELMSHSGGKLNFSSIYFFPVFLRI